MDVLTEVLNSLHLQGSLYVRAAFTAPWGVRFTPAPAAAFHILEEGACWLQLDDEPAPRLLTQGDIVVIPQRRGHQLSDDPTSPIRAQIAVRDQASQHHCQFVHAGGGGAQTTMICGMFQFENHAHQPWLRSLPALLHIPGHLRQQNEWFDLTLKFLAYETAEPRPGAVIMTRRLADALFIQLVRVWLETQPAAALGWLGALRDPVVGTALGHLHRDPSHPWTVAALAQEVGLSRSAFAARFTQLVGEPPLHYLTRWRMHIAVGLLRDETVGIKEVALRTGYGSEAAFSIAFKRHFGLAPGAYRREQAAPVAEPA